MKGGVALDEERDGFVAIIQRSQKGVPPISAQYKGAGDQFAARDELGLAGTVGWVRAGSSPRSRSGLRAGYAPGGRRPDSAG